MTNAVGRTRRATRRGAATIAVLALAGLGAAACGSDDKSSSSSNTRATSTSTPTGSTTQGSAEFCKARSDLNDSIDSLKHTNFLKEGTSGIEDKINEIDDNLKALRSSASDEARPQIDALQNSLSDFKDAIKNPGSSGVSGITDAAGNVIKDADNVRQQLQSIHCD